MGKSIEEQSGWRYIRVPEQRRTYAVKIERDFFSAFRRLGERRFSVVFSHALGEYLDSRHHDTSIC
jgi:hypothetical protein